MIGEFFEIVLDVINGFISALGGAFTGITTLFYDAESGFTILGTLLLIGLGMGLVYFVFNLIKGLIRK